MGFSLEAAIIVPLTIGLVTAVVLKSVDAYEDTRRNALREAAQSADRLESTEIYRLCFRKDGFPSDVRTSPVDLLRFCIYIEDQAAFILEVLDNEYE